MSRSHSHGGVVCEHLTKKACDLARKVALGQCSAMVQKGGKGEPYPCTHWAQDKVDDRGYCGTHIVAEANRVVEQELAARKRAKLDAAIDRFLAWSTIHHSVHEPIPDGWMPN